MGLCCCEGTLCVWAFGRLVCSGFTVLSAWARILFSIFAGAGRVFVPRGFVFPSNTLPWWLLVQHVYDGLAFGWSIVLCETLGYSFLWLDSFIRLGSRSHGSRVIKTYVTQTTAHLLSFVGPKP